MKSVISALVIFILIVVMVTSSLWYTGTVADGMLQYLYKYENNFSDLPWQNIENETSQISNMWKKSRTLMSMIFNHQIILELDASVKKLENAVKMQKTDDFIYEKDKLTALLKSLKEQQKITIANIM